MLLMTPTQAQAVAQALTEARVLSAYVSLLSKSRRSRPADCLIQQADCLIQQAARLSAALHAVETLAAESAPSNQPPATPGLRSCRRASATP